MKYTKGSIGRVFYIRFDHGDDLLEKLQDLAVAEHIKAGWVQLFGGMKNAAVVTGPKEPVMPPEPVWKEVMETQEFFGSGSIFWDGDKPLVHLHAAMGHHGETLTGCIRKKAEVYLIIEAVIFELECMKVTRPRFEEGGFNRPDFS